jgi:hypothetical protein
MRVTNGTLEHAALDTIVRFCRSEFAGLSKCLPEPKVIDHTDIELSGIRPQQPQSKPA